MAATDDVAHVLSYLSGAAGLWSGGACVINCDVRCVRAAKIDLPAEPDSNGAGRKWGGSSLNWSRDVIDKTRSLPGACLKCTGCIKPSLLNCWMINMPSTAAERYPSVKKFIFTDKQQCAWKLARISFSGICFVRWLKYILPQLNFLSDTVS